MTKFQKKVLTSVATSALLMQLLPGIAFASVSCTITGNGSDTDNSCDFASEKVVEVSQDNNMDVQNNVDVTSKTGDNEAKGNTGGDVTIDTGDATADIQTQTEGNTNTANVQGTSTSKDYNLEVSGNGTDSDNKAEVDVIDEVSLDQSNDADVHNNVDVAAETGSNEAKDNTGGDVSVKTGDVSVNNGVWVKTSVNANSATVGSTGSEGSLSLMIKDNGSDTDNNIDLAILSDVGLDQSNDADVHNDVDVSANTGKNEAEDNTGGDSEITTGDVTVDVTLDTMANFNQADVATGFLGGDVDLKVASNGTDSDNEIGLDLIDSLDVGQDNDLDVNNKDVEVSAGTGYNELKDNTSESSRDDSSVKTGDTESNVTVSTSGNANAFGGETNLEFSFDLTELMNLLSALSALLG
jgi:hypothetical protein